MKIPESIRIGGVEYEIRYTPDLNDGTNICYGYINFENSTIELSDTRGIGYQHRCITLWHEILHGIRNHAGVELENEEDIVDMFARGIYQVLQDNGSRLFDIESDIDAP